MATAQDFDWYISPADRFAYETQFARACRSKDADEPGATVALTDLDPVFTSSRLESHEFLTIWKLIDIRLEQRINKIQFVYFMHILSSRRRGRQIPIGLPLHIKEEFLKETAEPESRIFVRREVNLRDIGASMNKTTQELEAELKQLNMDLRATERELELAKERSTELRQAHDEIEGIASFTSKHESALNKEIDALRQNASKFGGSSMLDADRTRDLMSKLSIDRQLLAAISEDLRREQDAANAALAAQS